MNAGLAKLPLIVDLDETLIGMDLFRSGMARLVMTRPRLIPKLLWKLLHGRAAAKAWLAQEFGVDAEKLPYRAALLAYLFAQKNAGRKIYLISASDQALVGKVAEHLALFDGFFGSDGHTNLKGSEKAKLIKEKIGKQFVYAGDSYADLFVWKEAAGAILCGKARAFKNAMGARVEAMFV
jgi:phosphoserine phosphatase